MAYYTDIALECINSLIDKKENDLDFGCRESVVKIDSTKKERLYNRPKGEYYLIDCPNLDVLAPIVYEYIIEQTASYIKEKIKKLTKSDVSRVLVVCLGNENVISDSLGAEVFSKIITTTDEMEMGNRLQAIKTGVLGKTGIETSKLVKSVVDLTRPDVVMLVDSLCTRSVNRVATSIQITDAGIVCGGAVGGSGNLLNESFLHCPTLAIGMPFILHLDSIIGEVLNTLSDSVDDNDLRIVKKCDDLVVSPKNLDKLVKLGGYLIASAINMSVLDLSVQEQIQVRM